MRNRQHRITRNFTSHRITRALYSKFLTSVNASSWYSCFHSLQLRSPLHTCRSPPAYLQVAPCISFAPASRLPVQYQPNIAAYTNSANDVTHLLTVCAPAFYSRLDNDKSLHWKYSLGKAFPGPSYTADHAVLGSSLRVAQSVCLTSSTTAELHGFTATVSLETRRVWSVNDTFVTCLMTM